MGLVKSSKVLYEKGVLRRVSCWNSGILVVDDYLLRLKW